MAKSRSIGGIYASLSLRDKGFNAGLKNARNRISAFAKSVPGQITGALSFAGIVTGAASATTAASDLFETVSKSETVFGSSSSAMRAWAKTASDSFGQSESQSLSAAATMGNMFVAMGMGQDEAGGMSRKLVELAADLASFNNTSSSDAIDAIGAALRGESEPIRRYGVLLDDATLKAEALSRGLYNGTGNLAPASRALAAYGVILKQTTTAQGDFAKTADGLANSQRTITAKLSEAQASIGESLLPTVQSLASALKELDFDSIATGISGVVESTVKWSGALAKVMQYMPGQAALNWMAEKSFGGEADIVEARKMAAEMTKYNPAGTVKEPYYTDNLEVPDETESLRWFKNGGFAEAMRGVNGFPEPAYGVPSMIEDPNAVFSTIIPEVLRRIDSAPDSGARQVNAYQSRGLSLDGSSSPARAQETTNTLLGKIKDILADAKKTGGLKF